jgi:hypothetical protein
MTDLQDLLHLRVRHNVVVTTVQIHRPPGDGEVTPWGALVPSVRSRLAIHDHKEGPGLGIDEAKVFCLH